MAILRIISISDRVIEPQEFHPTYLCIKQHSVTGLKYLCKTTRSYEKMLRYSGSGHYWGRHRKIHGNNIETIWYCLFYDKEELVKFALMCSEQWDIINAKDSTGQKIWANEKFENGLDGAPKGYVATLEARNNISKGRKGKGKYSKSAEHCDKIRKAMIGKNTAPHSEEHIRKYVAAMTGKKRPPRSEAHTRHQSESMKGIPQTKVKCPYCPKEGGISNMKRWHFDNCKKKPKNGK